MSAAMGAARPALETCILCGRRKNVVADLKFGHYRGRDEPTHRVQRTHRVGQPSEYQYEIREGDRMLR
jgi:hypothetical protein